MFIVKKAGLWLLIVFFVTACSSVNAPVSNHSRNREYYQTYKKGYKNAYQYRYHRVRKGDTLYSIAWQYGLDYKQLARYNRIKKPYTIKTGQKLRLLPPTNRYQNKHRKKGRHKTHKKRNKKSVARKQKINQPKTAKKKYKYKMARHSKRNNHQQLVRRSQKWHWPAKGRIIQKFNLAKNKKGIDIALRYGSTIRAAAAGKVVYSGHGLTGYGLLIIIKHDSRFLSAYAHNSRLLVEEGQKVHQNQKIALAGKTSSDRVKLHFEIRKNGKPVNPLYYLP